MIWKDVNARYVKEGELLIDFGLIGDWWTELIDMNKYKVGQPYEYPVSFIRWSSLLKTVLRLPFRQLEGFLKGLSKYMPIPSIPSFQTLWRRIKESGLDVIKEMADPKDNMVIAMDSTGIKVANRGEWIRHKWKVKRGWIKLHVAVDIKHHNVVNFYLTPENVGDATVGEYLLDEITKRNKVKKLLADGAYGTYNMFEKCSNNEIEAGIKVRKDAKRKPLKAPLRTLTIDCQKENWDYWRTCLDYGQRWQSEGYFSSYKRRFGEIVKATTWKGIYQEIAQNICALNWLLRKRCQS